MLRRHSKVEVALQNDKCYEDTLSIIVAFIFLPERRDKRMMRIKDFLEYVSLLPEDCIEVKTAQEIQFHLPRKESVECPVCGSSYVSIDSYYPQHIFTKDAGIAVKTAGRRLQSRIPLSEVISGLLAIGCGRYGRRKKLHRER